MFNVSVCPICLNAYGTAVKGVLASWNYHIECPICGKYELDRVAFDDFLDPQTGKGQRLGTVNRARLAHRVRSAGESANSKPKIEPEFLENYIREGCPGPSPAEQAVNAIKYLGDQINRSGAHVRDLGKDFFIVIGAPSPALGAELLLELVASGRLTGVKSEPLGKPPELHFVNLTLAGWEIYEREKKGRIAGSYGFIAMKFGDAELESLVTRSIKPVIKSSLNFDMVDMRDVARAGVIDNIMRAQIRDAAFIVVDLTHDNYGAYWEAGYAEAR